MAGVTQADAEANLAAAQAALVDARAGEVEIKDRKSKPATIPELLEEIKYWQAECNRLSGTGRSVRGGTPA